MDYNYLADTGVEPDEPFYEAQDALIDPFQPDWDELRRFKEVASIQRILDTAKWSAVDQDGYFQYFKEIPDGFIEPESDSGVWVGKSDDGMYSGLNDSVAPDPELWDWRDSLRYRK